MRVILKQKYTNYKEGIKILNIQTLETRREMLCLRFAKKCHENEKVKRFFPKKQTNSPNEEKNSVKIQTE